MAMGRGVSHRVRGHATLSLPLRFAAKILYEFMPWGFSMLDETGFYAPSMAGHFWVSWA